MIRFTICSKCKPMFPDPVSAWVKASLSVDISLGITDRWMAVGAFRDSFIVK